MAPTHILVPLDGSPLATDALEHAFEVYDCPVTVLNVVTPLDSNMSEGGVLEVEDSRIEDARTRTDRLVERARPDPSTERAIDTTVETGDPAETILEVIDREDIDLVVMGGHGGPKSGTLRRLLGTVATSVVGNAPISVTVVR